MGTYGVITHDYNNGQVKITVKKYILRTQTKNQSTILEISFV